MAVRGIKQLPGLDTLKPAQQGRLDRLCGLYSIINAIDLAMYPRQRLLPSQRQQLFEEGISLLARSRRLERVLSDGMSERLWMRLRDALICAGTTSGAPKMEISHLPQPHAGIGLRELLRWIERHIRDGNPVMLVLWGAYDHYTVVAGMTPTKLLLFDSYGFRHVARSSLSIRTPCAKGRHKISRRSVSAIVVQS